MVAAREEGRGQAAKHPGATVTDWRGLAVHDALVAYDSAAEGRANGLMPEAHAQHRYLASAGAGDEVEAECPPHSGSRGPG